MIYYFSFIMVFKTRHIWQRFFKIKTSFYSKVKTLSFDEFLKSYTKICQITMGKHKRERSRSREKKKKKKRNRSSSPESRINKKSLKKIKKKSKKSKDSLPSIDDIISNKLKEKQLAGKGEPSVRF